MSDNFETIRRVAEETGYELVQGNESYGDQFFGVMILVKMSNRKYDRERDWLTCAKAAEDIKRGFDTVTAELDPEGPAKRKAYRDEVIQIYRDAAIEEKPAVPIFIEELPNGYCKDPCCLNRPWFRVTSRAGHIVIGWRKHVMSIDWKDSLVKKTGEQLFADESTTKLDTIVHAHGVKKATEYIRRLHQEAP